MFCLRFDIGDIASWRTSDFLCVSEFGVLFSKRFVGDTVLRNEYDVSCFSFELSYPTLRVSKIETMKPSKMPFNKCYFIVLEEKDFKYYVKVMETISEMFQEFPIFTIILSLNQPIHSKSILNNGNAPLVFLSPQKVWWIFKKFRLRKVWTDFSSVI